MITLAKTPVRTDELGPVNDSVGIARIIVAQDLVDNGASWQGAQRLAVALSNNRSLQDLQNFFAAVGEPREVTAGRNLGRYMIELQAATFDATGVMPVPCSDAPNNYGELLQAAARWQYALGDVFLPVWDGASDTSIYGSDAANHAFRYWHDMGHIAHHCSFTPDDETRLQLDHHLPIIAAKFGIESLEYSLYYADTVGQIQYVVENGRFPADQASFASAYIRNARLALNTAY